MIPNQESWAEVQSLRLSIVLKVTGREDMVINGETFRPESVAIRYAHDTLAPVVDQLQVRLRGKQIDHEGGAWGFTEDLSNTPLRELPSWLQLLIADHRPAGWPVEVTEEAAGRD